MEVARAAPGPFGGPPGQRDGTRRSRDTRRHPLGPGFVGLRQEHRELSRAELKRLVDGGKAAVAFAMFPTTIDDLVAIADAGGIMPPKSTWFEPKLRDGLLVHLI